MITPRFSLSQDPKHLTIRIRAPYCSLRELEVEAVDNLFLFFCKPYYLRLHLPGIIVENDNSKSSFDSDTGEFTFSYEKANYGEIFEDLDLITKFLVSKVDASYGNEGERKITVLASEGESTDKIKLDDLTHGYGFALQGQKHFANISSEFDEVFEVNPVQASLDVRRKLRLQYEQGKFDMGHYLGDYIEDEEIVEVMSQKSPWNDLQIEQVKLTDSELDFLKDLHNVDFDISEKQLRYVYNSLLDILYAYCYDQRATFYEDNSESGWTIVKLAASFCWSEAFETPRETLICAFRRSVIYPLYRNFQLNLKVLEDVKKVLELGEKQIIKCLINIYNVFLSGDCCRYILNNLFIKDYITYISKWDKIKWREYLKQVNEVIIKKEDLGLNLAEIERGFTLEDKLSKLAIKESDSDDSSEDSSDDSEESEESDSETERDESSQE